MQEIDRLTLARAQRGDRAAQRAVLLAHQDAVYALAVRMLAGDRRAAEDVAQDALLKLLEALPRFEPDGPAKLSTWVLTIAARTAIDAQRRRRRLEVAEPEEPASSLADPEQSASERELGRTVEAAMAELPVEQRAILVMRAYHDLDYDEIAAALQIELGTVKSRLSRARAALFEELERRGARP